MVVGQVPAARLRPRVQSLLRQFHAQPQHQVDRLVRQRGRARMAATGARLERSLTLGPGRAISRLIQGWETP